MIFLGALSSDADFRPILLNPIDKSLLRVEQRILIAESKVLMADYNDLRQYFRRYGKEAESKYYLEQLWESGYESEGYFSLHHKTLRSKIRQNKNERKIIYVRLKQIKKLLK